MSNSRVFSLLRTTLLAVALAACGGGGDPGPKPLSTHFQQSYIAQISVDQQGDVVAANSAWDVAKREQAKAEADLREAKATLDIAKNEAKTAKIDEDSARKNYDAAKASADQTRIAEAEKAQQAANLSRNAADARVKYYEGYSAWLKAHLRAATEAAYWREAQYELAMANLAQKNNIAPPSFNHDKFIQQEGQRAKRASDYRGKADEARGKASDTRDRWMAIQGEADKVLGKKSEYPDPMANKRAGDDPTAGGAGGMTVGGSEAATDPNAPEQPESAPQ